MTTMFETQAAHPADAITTVARVRLYDDAEIPGTQKIGFNCVAATALDAAGVAEYIETTGREVSGIVQRSTVDKPFVQQEFSVRPPLDHAAQYLLGQKLVDGAFNAEGQYSPEGIMFIDNTGNQIPDHPMDRGREVIAQSAALPRSARPL